MVGAKKFETCAFVDLEDKLNKRSAYKQGFSWLIFGSKLSGL